MTNTYRGSHGGDSHGGGDDHVCTPLLAAVVDSKQAEVDNTKGVEEEEGSRTAVVEDRQVGDEQQEGDSHTLLAHSHSPEAGRLREGSLREAGTGEGRLEEGRQGAVPGCTL